MIYEKEIDTMRHNMIHIRNVLGMNAAEFGGMIGVTRQAINNIEYGRNKLSPHMYLAILYVLEHQVYPNCSETKRKMIERLLVEKAIESDYTLSLVFE